MSVSNDVKKCDSSIEAGILVHEFEKDMHTFQNENLPMQYIEKILAVKMKKFLWKIFDFFLIFAQNIDCGYTLEPPRRGGSNE